MPGVGFLPCRPCTLLYLASTFSLGSARYSPRFPVTDCFFLMGNVWTHPPMYLVYIVAFPHPALAT